MFCTIIQFVRNNISYELSHRHDHSHAPTHHHGSHGNEVHQPAVHVNAPPHQEHPHGSHAADSSHSHGRDVEHPATNEQPAHGDPNLYHEAKEATLEAAHDAYHAGSVIYNLFKPEFDHTTDRAADKFGSQFNEFMKSHETTSRVVGEGVRATEHHRNDPAPHPHDPHTSRHHDQEPASPHPHNDIPAGRHDYHEPNVIPHETHVHDTGPYPHY